MNIPAKKLCLACALLLAVPAQAWVLRGGLSVLEEGDDRLRGGVAMAAEVQELEAKVFYFYRAFGPVEASTLDFALDKSFALSVFPNLHGAVGLAALRERTAINVPSNGKEDVFYNFGLHFGIGFKFAANGPFRFVVSWDSSIFPAGSGGIFLSTGRKQFLTIASGVDL